jgi:sulfur carrier protein ThiS
MVKIKLNSKEIILENKKSLLSILKDLNLIEECSIVLKNGKILSCDEKINEDDEIEILTFGWEKL